MSEVNEQKLTADEWLQQEQYKGIEVMDPDGWDRKDFTRSWAEPITEAEFNKRLAISTCKWPQEIIRRAIAGKIKDVRPANCRNRLRDEGKAYPRSGCDHCKNGGLMGCPFERKDTIATTTVPAGALDKDGVLKTRIIVVAEGQIDPIDPIVAMLKAALEFELNERPEMRKYCMSHSNGAIRTRQTVTVKQIEAFLEAVEPKQFENARTSL